MCNVEIIASWHSGAALSGVQTAAHRQPSFVLSLVHLESEITWYHLKDQDVSVSEHFIQN